MVKEKPILFNTEMVRAILEGRKKGTRRITKSRSRYQPGDILYVRETYAWCPCWDCGEYAKRRGCKHEAERIYNSVKREHGCYMYRASYDNNEYPSVDTWHPSIHMPKEAARLWLKVTDVRVERLHDIDAAGIRNEGLSSMAVQTGDMEIALQEWKILWDSTIKESDIKNYGWDANPWVWVIEFEKIQKERD